MGVLASEFGDSLKLIGLASHTARSNSRDLLLNLTLLAGKLMLAFIECLVTTIQGFLALHNAILKDAKCPSCEASPRPLLPAYSG